MEKYFSIFILMISVAGLVMMPASNLYAGDGKAATAGDGKDTKEGEKEPECD